MGTNDSLDTILALIEQMEATLQGLRKLRRYVRGVGAGMLEVLIEESESKIVEVKRRLMQ
jgi:hypothetical protein